MVLWYHGIWYFIYIYININIYIYIYRYIYQNFQTKQLALTISPACPLSTDLMRVERVTGKLEVLLTDFTKKVKFYCFRKN